MKPMKLELCNVPFAYRCVTMKLYLIENRLPFHTEAPPYGSDHELTDNRGRKQSIKLF